MRKVLTFVFILAGLITFARPVDRATAERAAMNQYLQIAGVQKSTQLKSFHEVTEGSLVAYYIFNYESGGFVIVSADDAVTPVLAYSDKGEVVPGNINPEAAYFLDGYAKEIGVIASLGADNSATSEEWTNLLNNNFKKATLDVGPLVTTNWDQGTYYNALCPTAAGGPGGKAWAGCVAVTMSVLMKYHEWPEQGFGYHTYKWNTQMLSADFANTTYDYASMPNSVTSSNIAVATLMYHAGVSVNMDYGADGSGAYSVDVPFSMINYFNFDTTTKYVDMADYTTQNWKNLLMAELDASRPVYYSGTDTYSQGGHAWICDGYRSSDGKFHMNWGWSGASNGYFAIGALNPSGYAFNQNNGAVIGVKPGNNTIHMAIQNSSFTTASRGIRYVCAVDSLTAVAVAYDGSSSSSPVNEATFTSDGGKTWTAHTITNATGLESSMVYAVSAQKAWVPMFRSTGSKPQGIYYTSDGGTTWSRQTSASFSNSASFPNCVHFWDENNGWCMGDPINGEFEIYTTNDGGATWTIVPGANIPNPLSGEYGTIGYYDVSGDVLWFGTNKGRIFRSDNRGLNYEVYTVSVFGSGAYVKPSFVDENHGIAMDVSTSTTAGRIAETFDGGQTWTLITTTGPIHTNDIGYVPGTANTFVSSGADGSSTPTDLGVSYSFDGGHTWQGVPATDDRQFLALDFVNQYTGFIGAFNGDYATTPNPANNGMYKMFGNLAPAGGGTAQISISVTSLAANAMQGLTDNQQFTISNTGTEDLTWTITIDPAASWLTIDPMSGTTPAGQSSTVDALFTAMLPVGEYNTNLVISSNAGDDITIPVTFTVDINIGVGSAEAARLLVYPNPASDKINISAGSVVSKVCLTSIGGQTVIETTPDASEVTLSTAEVAKGFYFLTVTTADGNRTIKVQIK